MDDLRILLYYPLGLLPSLFFAARFLIQWIKSEKAGRSYVEPVFWKLSLCGNFLLLIHFIIQVQYPFALIQAANAVISWRNLNLMEQKKGSFSTRSVILLFFLMFFSVTLIFIYHSYFLVGSLDLVRIPTKLWDSSPAPEISYLWLALGCIGEGLFAARFWVQWWNAEKEKESSLGKSFWLLSIVGSSLSLCYFISSSDVVGILNHSFGLVPYIRNLFLLKSRSTNSEAA